MTWRWGHLICHAELAAEDFGPDLALTHPRPAATPVAAAPAPPPTPRPPQPVAAPPRPNAAVPTPDSTVRRPAEPDTPRDLAQQRAEVSACTLCKLAKTRTNVVFGEGNPTAAVMFIGEAPGYHEDQQGRPFVGKAGQLLDKIIQNAMGMRREDVFIANVNKCRPPENRDPQPDEVAACLPHLHEQIRAIQPDVIVTLGRVAAHNLLSTTQSMSRLRGQQLSYAGTPVVATWHPAYLLRQPSAKAETWQDIKRVNRLLGRPEVPEKPGQKP